MVLRWFDGEKKNILQDDSLSREILEQLDIYMEKTK